MDDKQSNNTPQSDINTFFARIDAHIGAAEYEQALEVVRALNASEFQGPAIPYNCAGFLIDIGTGKEDAEIVREGLALAEALRERLDAEHPLRIDIEYTVGNGYSTLHKLCRRADPSFFHLNDSLLQKSKEAYRNAIRLGLQTGILKPDLFVNYGIVLSMRGRMLEAVEQFRIALNLEPGFRMARANMAEAMIAYANVVGGMPGTALFIEACQELKDVIREGLDTGARTHFESFLRKAESMVDPEALDTDARCSSEIKETGEPFRDFYQKVCYEERLFLNPLNPNHRCEAALYDSFALDTKDIKEEEIRLLRFAHYVNDIKVTYGTARMLAVQSLYRDPSLAFVHEDMVLNQVPGAALYSMHLEFGKAAYRTALTVLDKIAYVLNTYCELGYDSGKLYFPDLAGIAQPVKKGSPKHKNRVVWETTNDPLFAALIDLARDFTDDHFRYLRNRRNAFEHRFQRVAQDHVLDEDGIFTEELMMTVLGNLSDEKADNDILTATQFELQLLDLLRLTRSAIIYLICLINRREAGRPSKTGPPVSP